MRNYRATLANIMVTSKIIKNGITVWYSNYTSGNVLKIIVNRVLKGYLCTHIHGSIIHNSQNVEATQVCPLIVSIHILGWFVLFMWQKPLILIEIELNLYITLCNIDILAIFILPFHKHRVSFHLFVSFSIYFINVLFSWYRSFTTLVKVIHSYFTLFDVIIWYIHRTTWDLANQFLGIDLENKKPSKKH